MSKTTINRDDHARAIDVSRYGKNRLADLVRLTVASGRAVLIYEWEEKKWLLDLPKVDVV